MSTYSHLSDGELATKVVRLRREWKLLTAEVAVVGDAHAAAVRELGQRNAEKQEQE